MARRGFFGGSTPGASVALSSTFDQFKTTGNVVWGIADDWTWCAWLNMPTLLAADGLRYFIDPTGSSNSAMIIDINSDGAGRLLFENRTTAGTLIKSYQWDGFITATEWFFMALTWAGGTNTLLGYPDGSLAAATTEVTDDTGTMGNDSRQYFVERTSAPSNDALVGHHSLFSSVLTAAEITEIFNGRHQIDLRNDSGAYISSADCEHFYRPGMNNLIGDVDEGNGTLRDLNGTASLDVTDIRASAP